MKLSDLNIKLTYKPLTKKEGLGYWDEKTGEIVINSKLSKEKQDAILIHEFLHVTASALKQHRIIKKHPDHVFVTNACQQLLALFVASGKWSMKHKIRIR